MDKETRKLTQKFGVGYTLSNFNPLRRDDFKSVPVRRLKNSVVIGSGPYTYKAGVLRLMGAVLDRTSPFYGPGTDGMSYLFHSIVHLFPEIYTPQEVNRIKIEHIRGNLRPASHQSLIDSKGASSVRYIRIGAGTVKALQKSEWNEDDLRLRYKSVQSGFGEFWYIPCYGAREDVESDLSFINEVLSTKFLPGDWETIEEKIEKGRKHQEENPSRSLQSSVYWTCGECRDHWFK